MTIKQAKERKAREFETALAVIVGGAGFATALYFAIPWVVDTLFKLGS